LIMLGCKFGAGIEPSGRKPAFGNRDQMLNPRHPSDRSLKIAGVESDGKIAIFANSQLRAARTREVSVSRAP